MDKLQDVPWAVGPVSSIAVHLQLMELSWCADTMHTATHTWTINLVTW